MIEFDDKIRDLLKNAEAPVDLDVWDNIQTRLDQRKRRAFVRKMSYVAAAIILLALILPRVSFLSPELMIVELDDSKKIGIKKIDTILVPQNEVMIAAAEAIPEMTGSSYSRAKEIERFDKSIGDHQSENDLNPGIVVLDETINTIAGDSEKPKEKAAISKTTSVLEQIDGLDKLDEEIEKKERKLSFGIKSSLAPGLEVDVKNHSPNFSSGLESLSQKGILPIVSIENSLPISTGFHFLIPIKDRFGLNLGLNYTLLKSRYDAIIDNTQQAKVTQALHYIGLPIGLYYDVMSYDNMKFYVSGGGMVEKGLLVEHRISHLNSAYSLDRDDSVDGFQWSFNIGMGFEYRFIESFGIYVYPNISYFFENAQPISIRTKQPLQAGVELGFRFKLY